MLLLTVLRCVKIGISTGTSETHLLGRDSCFGGGNVYPHHYQCNKHPKKLNCDANVPTCRWHQDVNAQKIYYNILWLSIIKNTTTCIGRPFHLSNHKTWKYWSTWASECSSIFRFCDWEGGKWYSPYSQFLSGPGGDRMHAWLSVNTNACRTL